VANLPSEHRQIRTIGFDDAPHPRDAESVEIAGVVCNDARFEGMVWGTVDKDGTDATDVIAALLGTSKYAPQVHAVLLDGIAMAGLNVIDLPQLYERVGVPCITVMRKVPNLTRMHEAIHNLPDPQRGIELLKRAGTIHEHAPFVFQVVGATPDEALEVLRRTTDTGHVPEPLRLAHLITSAVIDGQSRGRA
jgi:endonuclease V-like protein UPF0215 family